MYSGSYETANLFEEKKKKKDTNFEHGLIKRPITQYDLRQVYDHSLAH